MTVIHVGAGQSAPEGFADFFDGRSAAVQRVSFAINETAGTTLFLRTQNDWELTSEGRKVFEIASRFSDDLTAFGSAQAEARDLERVVRVTAVDFLVSAKCSSIFEVVEKIRRILNLQIRFRYDDQFGNHENITKRVTLSLAMENLPTTNPEAS